MCFLWCSALSVNGQGLVGAPVDPYGESGIVGLLADHGQEAVRDLSRLVTVVTVITVVIMCHTALDERKKDKMAAMVKGLLGLAATPLLVHVVGTCIINNFGPL